MLDEIAGEEVTPSTAGDSLAVPPLLIEITQLPGATFVTLGGELDSATAPVLRDRLAEEMADLTGDLIIDMAGLGFVDSSGIALFVALHNSLKSNGQRLVLVGPTTMARRVLTITGLVGFLHIEPSKGE
jgi:anti-sigma B factor antagonist